MSVTIHLDPKPSKSEAPPPEITLNLSVDAQTMIDKVSATTISANPKFVTQEKLDAMMEQLFVEVAEKVEEIVDQVAVSFKHYADKQDNVMLAKLKKHVTSELSLAVQLMTNEIKHASASHLAGYHNLPHVTFLSGNASAYELAKYKATITDPNGKAVSVTLAELGSILKKLGNYGLT